MVPVIDAIAAAANATAIRKPNRQKAKPSERQIFQALCTSSRQARLERLKSCPFNIGRIPVRQSCGPAFCAGPTANLAAGQKGAASTNPETPPPSDQAIEIYIKFLKDRLARSLLI